MKSNLESIVQSFLVSGEEKPLTGPLSTECKKYFLQGP